MERKWVFSYVDAGESADGYPEVSTVFDGPKEAVKAMLADARQFVRGINARDCCFERESPLKLIISLNGVALCHYCAHELKQAQERILT